MTKLPHTMPPLLIQSALTEHHSLIECRTVKDVPKVIDFFEEDIATYIFVSQHPGKSLRQLMKSLRVNSFREGEVRNMLFGLLTIVNQLH